ncbi:forkhead box protein O [Bactrocera tryoni]|uniref:forkhead box protein O n=1 Tax=Bactrocera tryoni TaxID=59916 RepID=UPI001A957762|nr:forkhead box protein O [Bactrocera tryoni]
MKTESNYSCPNISSVRPYVPFALAHGNRLDLSMSLFPHRMVHPEEPKPQYSYIGLIAMAILSSVETKLVLSDIYQHILDNYPYFRARGPGWRNSIRHNLSLNDCFIKSGRSANGKGHYWAIHPANIDDFRRGDFRRRKAQRKVRKHMGLSLDDGRAESPSPPPLDLSSTQLTSTRLLQLPSPGNSLTTTHDFRTPNARSFNYLNPLLRVPPSSSSLQQAQQHIQDSYFGTAIMEHYTCMPSVPAFKNGYSTCSQQEYSKLCSNRQLDNLHTNDPGTQSLSEQSVTDNHKNSKISLTNGTAISTVAPHSFTGAKSNYYTHMHKRQFDVASLLAPDRNIFTTTLRERDHQTSTFDALEYAQFLKKKTEENGKYRLQHMPAETQNTHPYTLPVSQTCALSPLEIEYDREQEQEQDEIDVVANDIDEHSKQTFSFTADHNNKEHQELFSSISKSNTCSKNGAENYDDSDNENNIIHKRTNSSHPHPLIPSAVIEWRMLQQQPISVEAFIKKFGVSKSSNGKSSTEGFEDCYATKHTSSKSANPILNTQRMALEGRSELNLNDSKTQMELCEHKPNETTPKSLHVRRIIKHFHQHQQQHNQHI